MLRTIRLTDHKAFLEEFGGEEEDKNLAFGIKTFRLGLVICEIWVPCRCFGNRIGIWSRGCIRAVILGVKK